MGGVWHRGTSSMALIICHALHQAKNTREVYFPKHTFVYGRESLQDDEELCVGSINRVLWHCGVLDSPPVGLCVSTGHVGYSTHTLPRTSF